MDIYIDGVPIDETGGGGGGGGGDAPQPYNSTPKMAGSATAGTSALYSRGDHVHPSDTSKQDAIGDLDTIRSGAAAGATAYQKPESGIPVSDLAQAVQTSLNSIPNKADDSAVVHKTGSETIAGDKTFSDKVVATNSITVGTRKVGSTVGSQSFSQGYHIIASAANSHAEGYNSTASGGYAHAEGRDTVASAYGAHAEGGYTVASANTAHAEGHHTMAQNEAEHAQGKYNVSHKKENSSFGDGGNTLHSIGFGTAEDTRKNAVEVMQDGKVFVNGVGGYDGTNPAGEGVKDLTFVVDALDTAAVRKTGDETIAGDKTFTGAVSLSSPLRLLGEDGNWYLLGVNSSGQFYTRREDEPEPSWSGNSDGSVSIDGETDSDGTLSVDGALNDDGTLTVTV